MNINLDVANVRRIYYVDTTHQGAAIMQATISKWGNSLALRLPRNMAEEVKLIEGATVNLEVEDGALKITPSRKRFKLADLLADEPKSAEMDWGQPKGDEVW